MRILLRWLGRGFAVLAVLLVLALAGAAVLVWMTLPGTRPEATLPGLSAPVAITFDAHGIPRIRAETEADAWRALGLLHARDRMFQMESMRRGATGRLAELAGAGALRLDRYMRLLDLERRAQADFDALPAEARAALEAYAEGVNAWIVARGRFIAPEFLLIGAPEPWRPVHSLLWGKVMALWLSGSWRVELDRLRLQAILPPDRLAELWPEDHSPGRPDRPDLASTEEARLPAPARAADAGVDDAALARLAAQLPRFPGEAPLPGSASNSWAVAPSRSASGAALLATDPHLGYGAPILWYLARIELPGGRFLAGATAPGVPAVLIGRNGRIAWGFTTTGADAQDVVIERLVGADAYATPVGPHPFTTREATIRVRGAEPVTLRLRETRHGPVVSDLDPPRGGGTTVLALALAALAPGDTSAAGVLALNRARSIAEARAAAALITSPPQNLMVADAEGGLALYLTGRIPVRRNGDGTLPQRGWEGPVWTGFIPFDALPHQENPESGMLANANNRIVPPDHPVFLARDWPGDWRFRRIGQLLTARDRHDAAGFAAMQADTRSLFAAEVLPAFRALPRPEGTAGAALDLLTAWDGSMTADRPQPLIFHATLRRFGRAALSTQNVPADAWPVMAEFLAHLLNPDGRGAPWCGEAGCPALLGRALREAVAALVAEHGPDPTAWRWGPAHVARFEHPVLRLVPGLAALTRITTATAGDGETLLRAAYRGEGAGFDNVHGAGFRGVFDLASPDGVRMIVATGQSGHPMSRHWADLLPFWRDGELLSLGSAAPRGAPAMRLLPARSAPEIHRTGAR